VREQLVLLPEYLTAHLQLTLLALLLSTVVSLPLGVAIARFRWLESPTLALAGIIQTVPGLALLAVMVPLLAAMNLPSIGFLPAIVGLTLYGLFPILRNTVTGIRNVDSALKEAARGVGMTPMQQLWRVEIPLALPMIVAGLRTATVWLVGITTLSTPIGATSLGNYIFSGLQTRNYSSVLIGCVAAAGLALLLDGMIRLLEIGISARRRGQVLTSLAIMTSLCIYVGITLIAPVTNARTRPLVIGSKTFTEQYVLSSILAQWIEKETSRPTTLMQSLGSSVAFDALTTGEIDLYVDYSGTLWVNEMHRDTGPSTRREILNALRQFLDDEHNISMPAVLGFENAYALAVRGNDATRLTLRQISDLRAYAATLVMGGDYEFFVRPEWTAIQDAYGLEFKHLRTMDSTLMYQAIVQENVDVISAFSSDGRVAAYDLTLLEDDLDVIPPYDAIVLASPRVTQEYPDVIQAVARLDGSINADRMRTMNLAVDEMGEHPSLVAERFVRALR
jgi:osmoprotectant transport system permease protein